MIVIVRSFHLYIAKIELELLVRDIAKVYVEMKTRTHLCTWQQVTMNRRSVLYIWMHFLIKQILK